jgi:hypothetical protein
MGVQVVTEEEVLLPVHAAMGDEVEVEVEQCWAWLGGTFPQAVVPVQLLRFNGDVIVPDRPQRGQAGVRIDAVPNASQDVDDRFAAEPRHRGAANVV